MHIDSWEEGSQYPNGHFVRSIGPVGDIDTETAVILIEHELSAPPFHKALLEGMYVPFWTLIIEVSHWGCCCLVMARILPSALLGVFSDSPWPRQKVNLAQQKPIPRL